jgi:hypothetical protein
MSNSLRIAMTASLLVFMFFVSSGAFSQKSAALKATEDLPPGPMQPKASTSCLECHEAGIILQQRLNKGAWTREVDKMVRWGAVVDPNDRDALIEYLSANFSPDQPPYQAPRTSSKKSAAKNAK